MKRQQGLYRNYSNPPIPSPRAMVRRFYGAVLLAIVIIAGIATAAYFGRQASAERSAVKVAQAELSRNVPVLREARLKRVQQAVSDRPMADLYDASGSLVGTVTIHSPAHFAVSLTGGDWRYRPATSAQVEKLLGEPPPATDENLARIICHGVGALSRLWPDLVPKSVRMDKIEAMTATADHATVSFGLRPDGRDLGAAVEFDMRRCRILSFEIRLKKD
ncbi:MAG: hypothetical protein N2512_05825 [Armatimonadetes bacterium]|nr:hypothetical protein [Armatimonadota bacterium]